MNATAKVWHIEREAFNAGDKLDEAILCSIDDPDGFHICEVWSDVDDAEANARLIAAAPDLLAACKGVGIVLNSGAMRQFDGEPWIGRLRDAIEKAEGRS